MYSTGLGVQATMWPEISGEAFAHDPFQDEDAWMKSMNISDDFYNFILESDNRPTVSPDTAVHDLCSPTSSFVVMGENYKALHGYIALLICLFGTVANILNLIVLTRKEMATPINRMLTALAFADMLVMIEYVPFAFQMYILPKTYSFSSAAFVLFHSHFTQILHTISIQLTLTMAVWRYVALKQSSQASAYCTFPRCHRLILAAFLCPILICIPNYLMFAIYHERKYYFTGPYSSLPIITHAPDRYTLEGSCETLSKVPMSSDAGPVRDNLHSCLESIVELDKYLVDLSSLAKGSNQLLHRIHFWTFSVIVKLIPCVLLTFFMGWLVNTLYKANRRHKLLQAKSGTSQVSMREGRQRSVVRNGVERRESSSPPAVTVDRPTTISTKTTTTLVDVQSQNSSRRQSNTSAEEGHAEQRRGTIALRSIAHFRRYSRATTTSRKGSHGSGRKTGKRSDRTSKMLIAVLCLFLLTEFPQGIMALLSGVYGQEFFRKCYSTWAEIWDVLALLNSAINFILYCGMSKQFRQQFRHIFKPYCCFPKSKWQSIAQCRSEPSHATTVV